jgi:RAB protein geranylgeranyltransferase component A
MEEEEEQEGLRGRYDAVVVGTGMVESAVAASMAKAGKSVLHLDDCGYYGRDHATFSFVQLIEWADEHLAPSERVESASADDVDLEDAGARLRKLRRVVEEGQEGQDDEEEDEGAAASSPLSFLRVDSKAPRPHIVSMSSSCGEEIGAASSEVLRRRPSHPAWTGRSVHPDPGAEEAGHSEDWAEVLHPAYRGYDASGSIRLQDLVNHSRNFALDITCQVFFATGLAVDTLINSGVARYMEFKSMEGIYIAPPAPSGPEGGSLVKLLPVPCSRADVFQSKLLSPLEKRHMMKFLQFVQDWGVTAEGLDVLSRNEKELGTARSLRRPQNKEYSSEGQSGYDIEQWLQQPFAEFAAERVKLPRRLQDLVIYALALLPSADVDTKTALEAIHRHLAALGRYGRTALLSPMYGMGEVPQSLCRIAAVNGGIYILRRGVRGVLVGGEQGRCVGVVDTEGRVIACDAVVLPARIEQPFAPNLSAGLARRISILSGGVLPGGVERGVAVLPPRTAGDCAWTVYAVQLDEGMGVCCPGTFLLHLTAEFHLSGEEDAVSPPALGEVARALTFSSGVEELWHLEFLLPLDSGAAKRGDDGGGCCCFVGRAPYSLYLHGDFVLAREGYCTAARADASSFFPPRQGPQEGEEGFGGDEEEEEDDLDIDLGQLSSFGLDNSGGGEKERGRGDEAAA